MAKDIRLSGGIAFCMHLGALFLTGGVLSSRPVFDVERAQSSIEVFLVESTERSRQKETKDTLEKERQIQDSQPDISRYDAVTSASPLKENKTPAPKRSAAVSSEQGALTKAMPNYLKNRSPAYPRLAREAGYEGKVILNVEVSPEGKCVNIQIVKSTGYPILDNTALKAVKQWSFKPAYLFNRPVSAWVEVPVSFKLKDAGLEHF
jgi:protein TonB